MWKYVKISMFSRMFPVYQTQGTLLRKQILLPGITQELRKLPGINQEANIFPNKIGKYTGKDAQEAMFQAMFSLGQTKKQCDIPGRTITIHTTLTTLPAITKSRNFRKLRRSRDSCIQEKCPVT